MVEKLKKKIKEHFSNGPKAILIVVVILMTASIVFTNMRKTIIVSIDGKETQKITTFKKTYAEALTSKNIQVGPKDKVQPKLDTEIKDGSKLNIKKAVKVNVEVDGKKLAIQSAQDNIGNMLKEEGIKVKKLDRIVPSKEEKVKKGLNVTVTRVEEKLIKSKKDMDYETVVKDDDSLEKGDKKVVREGQSGEKEVTIKVVYEDGKEKARKVVSESIKKQPVSKVVAMGTKITSVNALSRGGSATGTPSGRSLRMRATAYTSSYEDTGKSPGSPGFGVTATGTTARRNPGGYSSIAVDPRVIPLGTKLFVEGYGYAIAEDTGGAIKGNVIDLYFDSDVEVSNWGSRWVNIYILD
ncbi:DUF348 domain-containing protein [Clostridium botulinum]|nr:DUF348 domain-containing protein [Clostridium botulinum]